MACKLPLLWVYVCDTHICPRSRYPLLSLTAWSYCFGALWMVLAQCYYLVGDTPERYHQRW